MVMMKRGREDESSVEDAVECLIRISCASRESSGSSSGRVMFECKTCGRAFSSFQALGGHSASHHKKPKPSPGEAVASVAVKVKARATVHECSICGTKFGLGQALGGHMRRHRIELKGGGVGDFDDWPRGIVSDQAAAKLLVPVLRRSLSKNKRVIMCMDLNLTPLENDLELLFGKMAPKVDRRLV